MIPDVILCWPDSIDYPLWREFINAERSRFSKVIVVFTTTNYGEDYRDFVRNSMADDGITFLESRQLVSGEDWRDVAVNQAIDASDAEWIWFTEQDFFIKNNKFWETVDSGESKADVLGYKDGDTRLHPSCLFVKRSFVDLTHRFFGVVPDELDHFAKFYSSLLLTEAVFFEIPEELNGIKLWHHMNGLSNNMALVKNGLKVTYQSEEFKEYLTKCLDVKSLDPRFVTLVKRVLGK